MTERRRRTFGIILVIVGVVFLFSQYVNFLGWGELWPIVLILIGAFILLRRR